MELLLIYVFIAIIVAPMFIFAPWVPTRFRDLERFIFISNIKKGDIIYDLGSGDGKVLFAIAKKNNCRLLGVESFFPLYLYSVVKKKIFYNEHKIDFIFGNFFNVNLTNATIVYVFGLPGKMDKLSEKLKKECKSGTKIVSYTFPISSLKEIERNKPTEDDLSIYVYEV